LGAVQGAPSFRKSTISPGCTPIQGADSDVPENRRSNPDAVLTLKDSRGDLGRVAVEISGWFGVFKLREMAKKSAREKKLLKINRMNHDSCVGRQQRLGSV
jgi:hypothetical protein